MTAAGPAPAVVVVATYQGKRFMIAIADNCRAAAIKIGDDPNLLVATGKVHNSSDAQAILDVTRAVEQGDT